MDIFEHLEKYGKVQENQCSIKMRVAKLIVGNQMEKKFPLILKCYNFKRFFIALSVADAYIPSFDLKRFFIALSVADAYISSFLDSMAGILTDRLLRIFFSISSKESSFETCIFSTNCSRLCYFSYPYFSKCSIVSTNLRSW